METKRVYIFQYYISKYVDSTNHKIATAYRAAVLSKLKPQTIKFRSQLIKINNR